MRRMNEECCSHSMGIKVNICGQYDTPYTLQGYSLIISVEETGSELHIILAVFMLETDYPSGRTWASSFCASDNSSKYKYGNDDKSSVQKKYLRCASVKTY